jgi:GxxExxY protein
MNIIQSCAENVYEQLGYGLSECAYQNAMCAELKEHFSNVQAEYHINQYYTTKTNKNKIQIANLRIDIFIDNCIILELKSISKLNTKEHLQTKRYKNITNVEHAFLINFGTNKLEFIQI